MIFVAFFVLLLFSAFFSGMETGIISLDRFKLEKDAKNDSKKKDLYDFVKTPDKFLGTTLIGNNIFIVMISSLATTVFVEPELLSENVSTLIVASAIFIFGEIIPKAVFKDYTDVIVPFLYPLIKAFYYIFFPVVFLVTIFNRTLTKIFGISDTEGFQSLSKEDLSYILSETTEDQSLQATQREMLEEALEFNDLEAKNVMIPRIDITALSFDTPAKDIISLAGDNGLTRYPVFKDSLDNIIGILIVYDLLGRDLSSNETVEKYMREASFFPETMDVTSLLKEMQKIKKSMVVIVDSFGGTAGIVTTEDILEELVGDIVDEYDDNSDESVVKVDNNTYYAMGHVEIDSLEDDYEIVLPQGDFETIAGLMINVLEKIPQKGDFIEVDNWKIEAVQVTKRKVDKVKITKID